MALGAATNVQNYALLVRLTLGPGSGAAGHLRFVFTTTYIRYREVLTSG
jgi:hypothetical protein